MAKAIMSYCVGIKCDNPACDYRDMSVKYEDYKKYVDKPCPKCGSNLLTRHDYNVCRLIMGISKLFGNIEVPKEKVDTCMHVKLDGTGNVGFEVRKLHDQIPIEDNSKHDQK